ncbi:MAG: glycosyltransferase family 4 protein, partial [Deltaproteobacteria bacterium]|nr:glycosyltransferase family 4 protein [Deltaproteobacteria bacterium]
TLVMDIYRAGNACHREWIAFRKAHGGPLATRSMAVNPLNRVINSIERRAFERLRNSGGTIVVLSPLGREQIRRHYDLDADRFVVIPPVVDLKRLDVVGSLARRDEHRKKLGIRDGSTALLHVGSGFRIKGLKNTIEALGLLTDNGLDYNLFVAGSDRKEAAGLKGLASRLGIIGRVHFLGGVKDLSGLYAASDLFVVPSMFETFGVAAVEALSFGLPVIVGRGAGAASFIEKEGAGRVIDVPADPARFAALIQETVEEEKQLRESGQMESVRKRRMNTAAACARESVMEKYCALIDRAARKASGKNIDKNRPKKIL